jgi:hypothetical protein
VFVKAGGSEEVSFSIGPWELSTINEEGGRVVVPGDYVIYCGFCQPDARSKQLTNSQPLEIAIKIEGNELEIEY